MPLVFRAMAILPKIAQYPTSCPPPKKTCQSQFLPLPPPASTCLYLMAEADLSALNSTTFCTNVDVANSCTYVCIRMLCLYTYMYLCMYVCMYVCVCVCIFLHTYMHIMQRRHKDLCVERVCVNKDKWRRSCKRERVCVCVSEKRGCVCVCVCMWRAEEQKWHTVHCPFVSQNYLFVCMCVSVCMCMCVWEEEEKEDEEVGFFF